MRFQKALYCVIAFWYFAFAALVIAVPALPERLSRSGQFWAATFAIAFVAGWLAYLVNIFRNPRVPAEKRPFWVILVGFLGPFAMPFYFFRYISGQGQAAPPASPAFSGWAEAAGYLGVLSVFATPAPISIVASSLALRDLHRHPERLGKTRALFGLVMGLIGTAALILFLVRYA